MLSVVVFGVVCELADDDPYAPVFWWTRYRERRRARHRAGVSFTEFADLGDGRRAILRSDRGFSWSSRHSPGPWHGRTRQRLTDEIRDYLAYEEEECCLVTPESVSELVRRYYDIEVDPASVEAALKLPRRVEFGPRVLEELSRNEPSAAPSA